MSGRKGDFFCNKQKSIITYFQNFKGKKSRGFAHLVQQKQIQEPQTKQQKQEEEEQQQHRHVFQQNET